VEGLHDYERGPYTEGEKLGLRAADRLHRSAYELDDEFYAELKRVYRDDQIIELMATAAAFEFFTRFVDALRIPTTPLPADLGAKK
jgi:alkylhydroperoxidase family enzyme